VSETTMQVTRLVWHVASKEHNAIIMDFYFPKVISSLIAWRLSCGLYGPGCEFRCGQEIFLFFVKSRTALRPTQPPSQGVPWFFTGNKEDEAWSQPLTSIYTKRLWRFITLVLDIVPIFIHPSLIWLNFRRELITLE